MHLELKLDITHFTSVVKVFHLFASYVNCFKTWVWKNITCHSFFPPCKEKVKGRMGRTAEKRKRRAEAEATGEERKRGDSCHGRINALRILLVSRCGVWRGWRISYRHSRVWASGFRLERVMFLVYTLEFPSDALLSVCAVADALRFFFCFTNLFTLYTRDWQAFSVKGQRVNTLGFVVRMVSVANTQLC